ncbi:MAG TPA: flagellar export protein FliJ [Hydrogenophaga sp.]|uniref:flagellar export protein FliJ n=1 Tax=Hydrogenophaga sp. TaxID=1904254 RepID=UPI002CE85ABD|nr:flagellar export protein FliJ [Hydrogenophaga sp.]HMN92466.1 flagellar export protein FliJ [Hydrogenophaga sp.]HMP11063.1 flagellar export protein FliJ [Hydrogenophaga sp.]
MKRIETLNKVVELAEQRRDEALAALGRLEREMQQARQQMDQLEAYASEAQQRWSARRGSTVDPAVLGHHRQFMQKIEHAIGFQRSVLASRQNQIEQQQAQVHSAERDLAGLRRYTERQQQLLVSLALRQEQKQTDEMAMVVYLRQRQIEAARNGGISQ